MSIYKIINLDEQILSLKKKLPIYMSHHGYDLQRPIKCINPEHDDRSPSMSVFTGDDGIPKLHCFSCGVSYDVFNCAHVLNHKPITGPRIY